MNNANQQRVPSYVEEAMCQVAHNGKHTWDADDDGMKCGACGRDAVEILETLIWQATV